MQTKKSVNGNNMELIKSEHPVFDMKQAAEYAKLCRSSLYLCIKKKRIKAFKKGRCWVIKKSQIDYYLKSRFKRDDIVFNGERVFDFNAGRYSILHITKILSEKLNEKFNYQRVYYLIRCGKLKSKKIGLHYVISEKSIQELINSVQINKMVEHESS